MRFPLVAVIALAAALGPRGRAAPLPVEPFDVVRPLLDQADREERRGNHEIAVRLYLKALELHPDRRIWFFVGRCQDRLGRAEEAANAFHQYLPLCASGPREWCDEARQALARLGPRLGRLELLGPDGLLVRIDDRPLQATPLRAPFIAAGPHRVALLQEAGARTLQVPDGRPVKLELASLPPARRPGWRLATGAALLAGGGMLVVLGGVMLAHDLCSQETGATRCEGQAAQRAAEIAPLIVGGAAFAGGVVLLALPPRRGELRLAPQPAGLQLAGRF
jgi:hypothetical protein